jgi:Fe-S cluster assembly ATP-binding protein
MLKIKNLTATSQEQIVLDDINLEVKKNEIHVILGPEKAGKTALMYSLVGLPYVEITDGSIHYKSKKINNQAMHQRSQNGIIGVFSELIEIPNQTNWGLMESVLKYRKDPRSLETLKQHYSELCESLGLGEIHGYKDADSDSMTYSEAIKNEFLWLLMLDPSLALIDNFDERLEEEDKKVIIGHVAEMAQANGRATIIFSKDKSVLEAVNPTHVHVMVGGKLILSGEKELLQRIQEDGYSKLSAS